MIPGPIIYALMDSSTSVEDGPEEVLLLSMDDLLAPDRSYEVVVRPPDRKCIITVSHPVGR
jgi:hypothetical protein